MKDKRALLTAADVRTASGLITINPRTIVTPSAWDLANSMGIQIVVSPEITEAAKSDHTPTTRPPVTHDLAPYIDHTNLSPTASESEIVTLVAEGELYGFATVCVLPTRVATARRARSQSKLPICSVAGFPTGAHDMVLKAREASEAIENGACEIDMVANHGWLTDGDLRQYAADILVVRRSVGDQNLLKVIIEASRLTPSDLVTAATIAAECGADFVKTSTGVYGHARIEDVALLRRTLPSNMRIKAAGGIKTAKTVRDFLSAGADRVGTSSSVDIMKMLRGESPE